jgi:polysaccharide biosynthesis/export protein
MMNTARLSKFFCKMLLVGLSFLPFCAVAGLADSAAAKPRTSAKPSQVAPRQQVGSYTLGSGDRIRMDIFNVPEYSGEYPVLVDGTLNLPIIGAVSVNGLTLAQASQVIEARYARYVKRPTVTVGLLIPRPIQVAIAGEINRAGSYTIPLTETRKFPTLSQFVQLAGGASQTADLRRVFVRRNGVVKTVNLLAVLQNADVSQDVTLRDGDVVYINTATSVDVADIARTSSSNLGSQDTAIKIAILGEVSKPGTYSMKAEGPPTGTSGRVSLPTITEALKLAGGATTSADASNIIVRRKTKTGMTIPIRINLMRLLNNSDINQDLVLQDGDTITIPADPVIGSRNSRQLATSSFGPQVLNPIKVAIVGEVNRPGTYNLKGEANNTNSISNQNINFSPPTITQAIQAAGGIRPTADVRDIVLRRYDRRGNGQAKNVNLWTLLTQGDTSQDLILQEGDQIYIPVAKTINPAETDILANAPFSPTTIKVNIVGEIKGSRQNGATLELSPTTTLNQAILAAGGFDPVRANKNSVDLIRLNPNGTVTKRTIGVDFASGINDTINPTLRNNDIVVIGRSGTTRVGDGLGSVLNPLSPLLTILNLFRR